MSHETTVARRQVEVTNSLGLHMRPANKFVELALQFQAEIRVHYNGNEYNGKSILELTSLAAECGTLLELEAAGPMPPRPWRRWPIWSRLSSTRMRTGSQPNGATHGAGFMNRQAHETSAQKERLAGIRTVAAAATFMADHLTKEVDLLFSNEERAI